MTKLEHIEEAVEGFSPEVLKFRAWFEGLQERLFDDAIERDAKSGKLEPFIAEAMANAKAGRGEEFQG